MKRILLVVVLAVLPACSTVHQEYVEPRAAGFYVKPIAVPGGFLIDAAFRDRYNALVAIYGQKKLDNGAPVFVPPLRKDDGIREYSLPGQWFMTEAAMQDMVLLSDLHRRGAPP